MLFLLSDVPAGLTAIDRTGWTTAAQMRYPDIIWENESSERHTVICPCVGRRPASAFRENPENLLSHYFFLFEWLHTAVTAFLIFQTKDKLCDIIDTTYLYPFTTTVVAKTTSRSQEATAGQGTPSTSHSPTSIPTEGKIKQNSDLERAQSFSVKYFCQDAKWSGAFAGTVLYCYWRVCSFATSTRHFSLMEKAETWAVAPHLS